MGFFNRSKKQKEEETLPANKPMQTEGIIETTQSGISTVTDMIMADMDRETSELSDFHGRSNAVFSV